MPYKTPYGSHYHMTLGCHGADIPCDATGLFPCSDCCCNGMVGGAPGGMGGAFGSGMPGASMPRHGNGDTYAAPGRFEQGPQATFQTDSLVSSLRAVVGEGPAPSVASQGMPAAIPTELIAQLLSTGMVGSIDYDMTSGVLSFKMGDQRSGVWEDSGRRMPATPQRPKQPSTKMARDYGSTNTQDAIREIRGGTHNSLERYLLPDGTLAPEREAVHRAIIDKVLSGKIPVDGQAVFRMLGGGPASGKSSVVKAGCVDGLDEQSTVGIDSDSLKEELPGYADMSMASSGAAAYYHEESSALAKRIMQVALSENYNVTLDGTGNGSVESVRRKIAQARKAGHKVTAVYVTVDIDTAIERNRQRYERMRERGLNPRKVPARIVAGIHKGVSTIFPQVAADFDEVELYDNSGPMGSKPVLVARGGAGRPAVPIPGREREYFEFLNKK